MSKFETLADFAKRRDVSKACVTKWKSRGLLRLNERGLVDVAATEELLNARPERYRGGAVKGRKDGQASNAAVDLSAEDPSSWSTAEAIRQKEIAQARLRQIEADTAAGAVVPIADVCKAVAADYAVVRSSLLAMPAKLAHRLAAARTPEATGGILDAEIRAVLEGLTADKRDDWAA
jgi:hypothetical protein